MRLTFLVIPRPIRLFSTPFGSFWMDERQRKRDPNPGGLIWYLLLDDEKTCGLRSFKVCHGSTHKHYFWAENTIYTLDAYMKIPQILSQQGRAPAHTHTHN